MRVALIGPGAVGLVVAGALVRNPDVSLVIGGRAAFERLVVRGVEPAIDAPATVLLAPAGGPIDLVLLATKAHQTTGARAWLDAWAGPATIVVVLQNGVEQAETGREVAPASIVVPAVVACPADRTAPGVATLRGPARLTLPAGAAASAVAAAFAGSHVEVAVTDDWRTAAWQKLLLNAAAGAVTTLARRPGRVLADPGARALVRAVMHEAAAVARADGAALPPEAVDGLLAPATAGGGEAYPSITVDRLAGRPCEWRARNEVIVRKAAVHGVPVPLNAALTTLLRLGEPTEEPP